MRTGTVVAIVAATSFFSQSAGAFDYKAARDFSYQNPGGVWSYARRQPITDGTSNTVLLFEEPLTSDCTPGFDCWWVGNNVLGINTTNRAFNDGNSNTVVIGENMIQMHASSEYDTVVRYRAPTTGSYRMQGYFVIMDSNPNSVMTFIQREGHKRFIYKNRLAGRGAKRDDNNPKPGKQVPFDVTVDLNAGEYVAFGVNADGDWTFGSTGFDVKITPPLPN